MEAAKDTFRKSYHTLHQENQDLIKEIKSAFEVIERYLNLVKSREMSIALTNLEQSAMWATKAIVLEDLKNGGQPVISTIKE